MINSVNRWNLLTTTLCMWFSCSTNTSYKLSLFIATDVEKKGIWTRMNIFTVQKVYMPGFESIWRKIWSKRVIYLFSSVTILIFFHTFLHVTDKVFISVSVNLFQHFVQESFVLCSFSFIISQLKHLQHIFNDNNKPCKRRMFKTTVSV